MAVPKSVVAIDDDPNVRTLIERVLCPPEFETLVLASAPEALEACRHSPPDVILSDYLMPGMGGGAFLEIVKSFPQLREVPFLFLTAVRLPAGVLEKLRPDAVLRKPFPVQELRRVVERVIATRARAVEKAARAAAAAAIEAEEATPDGGSAQQDTAEAAGSGRGPAAPHFPYGRFSSLVYEGRRIQVMTEQIESRAFTINSVITCGGIGLRRIESSLPHPLSRTEDFPTVKEQIDFQHEAVRENLGRHLVLSERATLWMQDERHVSASLLAWAIGAVVRHLVARLNESDTQALVRKALPQALAAEPALQGFEVDEAGRVSSRTDDASRAAAAAIARCSFKLVRDALDLPAVIAGATVLHLVRERVDDLGHAGFLTALAQESDPDAEAQPASVRIDGVG